MAYSGRAEQQSRVAEEQPMAEKSAAPTARRLSDLR
jgi:hypothetical protein